MKSFNTNCIGKKVETFQYLSALTDHFALQRLIYRTRKYAQIIIDLEDSVMDVLDQKRTIFFKAKARKNLAHLFSQQKQQQELSIRVNSIHSVEFLKDIDFLQKVKNVHWKYLVLPKVESSYDIKLYLEKVKGISFGEIIVCIESDLGVNQLNSILKNNTSKIFSKIQFGHFDYFLSKEIFPIPDQTDFLFWEICERVIKTIEDNGFTYLHTPLNLLNSPGAVSSSMEKLEKTCTKSFGFATISLMQSINLFNYKKNGGVPISFTKENHDNPTLEALKIKDAFTNYKKKEFGFFHNKENGRFITPHDYLAAANFLSKNDT